MNILGTEVDIPFVQNPFTNHNQGAVPILQKNWNGFIVPQQKPVPAPQNQNAAGQGAAAPTPAVSYASSSGPSYDPGTVAQFDTAIGTTQSALDRLPNQLGIAQGNINSQYTTNQNELNSSKDQAKNNYDTSTLQNKQSFRTSKNQIADQASSGLRGLLRTLGAYGAGGSSDAMYVAPQAVATEASQQRSGAGQNYAQNQQSLDTNWNNFETQDKTARQKLEDWRTQQMNSATAQSESTKQQLLSKIADLMGQKASYTGGNYKTAAQPYLSQADALSSQIDELGRLNPTYNGSTPVYTAPNLSSYDVGNGTTASVSNALESSATPYLSLLMANRDRNQLGA